MSAWGVGILEDDRSLDWIGEEYSVAGVEAVRDALQLAIDTPAHDDLDLISGVASRVAAEIVAVVFGAPCGDAGNDDLETLKEHAEQVVEHDDLPEMAVIALARLVADNSELNELWSENDDENSVAWHNAIADLTSRLEGLK